MNHEPGASSAMHSRKLILLLWTVIAVLVVGGVVGGGLLVNKVEQLSLANLALNGDNASLKRQVVQAKATPKPYAPALPEAQANAATPTPTAAPVPAKTTVKSPSGR
jgi:flagellar basal body-associated protein FliL